MRHARLATFFVLAVLIVGVLLVIVVGNSGGFNRVALQDYLRSLGAAGWALLLVAAFLATLFPVPLSPLGIIAGALYGFLPAVAALLVGATSAGALGFYATRHGVASRLLGWIRRTAGVTRPRPIDPGRNWVLLVFLLRIFPVVPYGTATYVFAFTRVPWWDYLVGSFLGLLPVAVLSAWLGSQALEVHSFQDALEPNVWAPVLALVVLLVLGYWAQHRWRAAGLISEEPTKFS